MLYRDKPSNLLRKQVLVAVGAILVIVALAFFGGSLGASIKKDISAQTLASIQNAVLQTAVQCYAVEGSYPQSLSYLEENYGLQLNHKQYIVTYEVFASNVMPDIAVLQR